MEPTDHDQLFKSLVRAELPDFLTLFFPELAARFDLSAVKWLDKELFPNPPDGPQHVLDLVAELTAASGTALPTLALVHVEIESEDSVTDIERRLPEYYFHLRRTQRKPVQPLVVFLKVGLDGIGTREIHDPDAADAVFTFRYRYVGLRALPAARYLRGPNLLGVALSALMKAPRHERIPFGVEAIQRIGESDLSDGRKALLADCVEAYIDLPADETTRFRSILEASATGRVPQMHKTRVQIATEQTAEQIRKENILRVLAVRCGPVPQDIAERLEAMTDATALDSLLVAACKADTHEQFRAAVGW